MSHKRSKRNTKKVLKKLKAKRQRYSFGGYGGGGIPAGYNAGEQVRREGLTTSQWEAMTGRTWNPTGAGYTPPSGQYRPSAPSVPTSDPHALGAAQEAYIQSQLPLGERIAGYGKDLIGDAVKGGLAGAVIGSALGAPSAALGGIFTAGAESTALGNVAGDLAGAAWDAFASSPVGQGVAAAGDAIGNTAFFQGSNTYMPPNVGTNTSLGYDPTGGTNLGTGAGTVSGGAGTAASGGGSGSTAVATAATSTSGTAGEQPTGMQVNNNDGDPNMATEQNNNSSSRLAKDLDRPELPEVPDATESVVKTDKSLVTAPEDVVTLNPMEQLDAQQVETQNIAIQAAQSEQAGQAAAPAPMDAATVETVTAEQLKQQKAGQAFAETQQMKDYQAAEAAHMAMPERQALVERYQAAAANQDTAALEQLTKDIDAFDAPMKAKQEEVGKAQAAFMASYGDPEAVKGEVRDEALAEAEGATLTERATVSERDTEAEQAALAETADFDMSTESMVDPVTGEQVQVASTPEAEAAQREAITDDTFSKGEATQIKETLGYEVTKSRPVKGEAAKGAAVEMLAEVADLPPDISEAILEDPEKVVAQLDNAPVEVKAAVAALPTEALVSSQMESLLGSMEEGKTPIWAKPAVDKVNAMLASRGLSSSSVGRDSLFNAIIQSALPMAQSNAQALQARAAQNLSNQQQANVESSKLDMSRRLANLSNQQTAASQTAQMANDMKKLQGTFKQEAIVTSAQQDQQIRIENLRNRQRSSELNAQNQQATMALNLGNEQQMELANLEIEASVNRDNMTADNQRKLAEMNVAAEFLSKNAELKQQMDIANMSNEQQMRLANLQAQNQASSDNLDATTKTELANLNATLNTNLKAAELAQQMNVAQLNVDQQTAIQNATTVANIDLAKFDAEQQVTLVNSKFMQTMTLENFSAENTAILQNATALANMDIANADQRTKLAIQNAQTFLSMDLANMSNEQQANMLKSQQDQQMLLSDSSAANATLQFNAASENQTNQFMAQLAAQVDQFNVTSTDTMNRFNVEQENKVNAENAGNMLQAEIANATLVSETERFNANMQNQRDQFNASNAQAIQQADLTWRRNANTADTAAMNDANRLNIQNGFNLTVAEHTQLWQEFRDEGTFANNNYENDQQRKVALISSIIASEGAYSKDGVATAESLVGLLESFDLL